MTLSPICVIVVLRKTHDQSRLYLLGPPRIERDGVPVMVDTAKAIARLAYPVLTETSQRRETLIGLLWPESDQAHGRPVLRRTLSASTRRWGANGCWPTETR